MVILRSTDIEEGEEPILNLAVSQELDGHSNEFYNGLGPSGASAQAYNVRATLDSLTKKRSKDSFDPLVAGIAMKSVMPILKNVDLRQFDRRRYDLQVEILR